MEGDSFEIEALSHLTFALEAVFHTVGPEVVSYVKDELSVPVQRRGSQVIRSAPGEPPRMDTGLLRSSVDYEVLVDFETVTLRVTANAPYAGYLELGTDRMAARPYLAPAQEFWTEQLPQRMGDELASTLY